VTVKGSSVAIDIYTYDCYQDHLFKEEQKKKELPTFKPTTNANIVNRPRRRSKTPSINKSASGDMSNEEMPTRLEKKISKRFSEKDLNISVHERSNVSGFKIDFSTIHRYIYI
jgi:hypothetical protein